MKTMTGWKNERMNEYIRSNIDPNVGLKKCTRTSMWVIWKLFVSPFILRLESNITNIYKHTKSYSKIHTWHVWSYLVLLSRRVFTWSSRPDNLIAILSHDLGDVSVQLKLQRPQVLCYWYVATQTMGWGRTDNVPSTFQVKLHQLDVSSCCIKPYEG